MFQSCTNTIFQSYNKKIIIFKIVFIFTHFHCKFSFFKTIDIDDQLYKDKVNKDPFFLFYFMHNINFSANNGKQSYLWKFKEVVFLKSYLNLNSSILKKEIYYLFKYS